MKRDIDGTLAFLALIGLMFVLPLYAVHSLVVAVAVSCITGLASWGRMRPVSRGERRSGRDKVEIVVAQPPTPAEVGVQDLTSPTLASPAGAAH